MGTLLGVHPIVPWYKWYVSGLYCQLGDYILPTTLYRNLKNPLIFLGQFGSVVFENEVFSPDGSSHLTYETQGFVRHRYISKKECEDSRKGVGR